MKTLRPSSGNFSSRLTLKPLGLCFIFVCAMVVASSAQVGKTPAAGTPEAGIPAGGKWLEFQSEEKMTGAQKNRFELEADNLLPDSDAKAKVLLFCVGGKLALGDFRPNLRIGPPNRASFWEGKPQMRVRVRVDNSSSRHNWNWVNGRFLAMDKDTVRQLIGANIFKVEFQTPRGPQIAEFSPAGLDLALVRRVCSLKPEKPD
jgi:hypothetical protein